MSRATHWRPLPTTLASEDYVRPLARPGFDLPGDDWHVIVTARPNVLLEGPAEATAAVLRALRSHLQAPVATWHDGPPAERPATLIIAELASLSLADQHVLLRWLDLPGDHVQVISTSTGPAFSLVERDLFLPALYYRLNIVRLDAGPWV